MVKEDVLNLQHVQLNSEKKVNENVIMRYYIYIYIYIYVETTGNEMIFLKKYLQIISFIQLLMVG